MSEFFGELERIAADLYPWRWAIGAGVLVVLAAIAAFGYRKGWHAVLWQRRRPVAIIGAPLLALAIFLAWDLGSPLFTNKTVEEEFPFSFSAVVPSDMDQEDVEKIMAGLAAMDQEVVAEAMPDVMTKTKAGDEDAGETTSEAMAAEAAMEEDSETMQPAAVKLKTGSFRDQDSFHKGSGQATIYRAPDGSLVLRVENFKVTNGPDLHVILTPHQDPNRRKDLTDAGHTDLGKLKGNIGNQNYPIPDDVDIDAQSSVVIYCQPFHVVFSVASLEEAG